MAYAASSAVFSRSAPTHPVNPMTKVMAPAQMKMKAGSRVMLVMSERLWKVFFSVHAHTPIASMLSPISQKMTLNPKMTYLRQHETSLWSLLWRLLRLLPPFPLRPWLPREDDLERWSPRWSRWGAACWLGILAECGDLLVPLRSRDH